jgi:hypothetical protein
MKMLHGETVAGQRLKVLEAEPPRGSDGGYSGGRRHDRHDDDHSMRDDSNQDDGTKKLRL